MAKALFAIVRTDAQAEQIVANLKAAGFSNDDISALFPDQAGTRDFAYEQHTKAPEGTSAGFATGGIVGGTLGWLAGIGAFSVTGLGSLIAAGPIATALSGAALGGLGGALVGMGSPEYEAKRYEGKVRDGNILLSVHADDADQRSLARAIFEGAGAEDISSTSEARPAAAY